MTRFLIAFLLVASPSLAADHVITVDDAELNVLAEALYAQPYSKVVGLIAKIQQQIAKEKENAKDAPAGDKPVAGK